MPEVTDPDGNSVAGGTDTPIPTPAPTYTLLTAQPDDWAENYTNYYTKSGNEYIAVTGNSAPEFATDTYYSKSE